MLEPMKDEDRMRRTKLIRGLRDLADFLESKSEVQVDLGFSDASVVDLEFYIPGYSDTAKEDFAEAVKLMGSGDKRSEGHRFEVVKSFGDGTVAYIVGTSHEAVCTKRIVSKRTVMEEDIDYDKAPKIMKERVIEEVEWICPESILAS